MTGDIPGRERSCMESVISSAIGTMGSPELTDLGAGYQIG